MAEERWRQVVGFEGQYEVSDWGRVRSVDRVIICSGPVKGIYESRRKGIILRPGPVNEFGHLSVCLGRTSGSILVHHIVMEAFVGPRLEGFEVAHADGNATNNYLYNLRYTTRSDNNYDCSRRDQREIPRHIVAAIKTAKGSAIGVARKFGVSRNYVSYVKSGVLRAHG